jgi:hypothetical protein
MRPQKLQFAPLYLQGFSEETISVWNADMSIPHFVLSLLHSVWILIPVAFSWLESQMNKCYERACASPPTFLTKVSAEVHPDF